MNPGAEPHTARPGWSAVARAHVLIAQVLIAHELLRRASLWRAVIWGTLLTLLLETPMSLLIQAFDLDMGDMSQSLLDRGAAASFTEAVVIAPILETALVQALPIGALRKWTRLSPPMIILLCAVGFGALHTYSVAYQFATFFSGLGLAWIYLARRDGNGRAFTITALVHAAANLLFWVLLHTLPEGSERQLSAEDAVQAVVVCGAVAAVLWRQRLRLRT